MQYKGFTIESIQNLSATNSHVWEHIEVNAPNLDGGMEPHLYNKKTGQVKTIVSYNQKKGGGLVTYVINSTTDCSFCN